MATQRRTSAFGSSYTVLHEGPQGTVLLRDEVLDNGYRRVRIEAPEDSIDLPDGFGWKSTSPDHASVDVCSKDLGSTIADAIAAVS